MPRIVPLAIALATVGACAPAALAGTISGSVFQDYNSNGAKDVGAYTGGSAVSATDAGLAGVAVRAFDSAGNQVAQATTGADGTYALQVDATGTVRVEFDRPSGYQSSFAGANSGTSVQFVDGAGASGVDFGVSKPAEYCQNNPGLVSCVQLASGSIGDPATATYPGAIQFSAAFTGPTTISRLGQIGGWGSTLPDSTIMSPFTSIGSTFGIGADRQGNAYYGTYVKRHSPYGPAGAVNAVYVVNRATGATHTFATLGNQSLPAHRSAAPVGWPAYSADGYRSVTNPADANYSNVYSQVGRAGLGDVDVSPDGSTLYAVEMTQGASRFWTVPINGAGAGVTAGTPSSVAIPAPSTYGGVPCTGNWHPMGIGLRGDTILVGGVCGGDETKWVANPADTTPASRTNSSAFVLQLDAAASTFSTVAAFSLSYPKSGNDNNLDTMLGWQMDRGGLWRNWTDIAPVFWGGTTYSAPYAQAMLANIEIMDNGDLALAFRDRAGDQTKTGALSYESTPGSPFIATNHISAAEVLRLCKQPGGGYLRESGGACGSLQGAGSLGALAASGGILTDPTYASQRNDSPLFWLTVYQAGGDPSDAGHAYTSLGGAASMPGSPYLWLSQFDSVDITVQGFRAFGPCPNRVAGPGPCGPRNAPDGAAINAAWVDWGTYGWGGNGQSPFGKGNGLGDLELVCDSAPVQIGNRIWIDSNANGLQDPGEAPAAGVTVHLYDANGTLVGTAITDAQGQYYFSSTVVAPASGDGSNVGGGLVVGQAFVIRIDNPADFTGAGPLAGYSLTASDVATAPAGANATSINSKASTVSGFPQMSVPARGAGINSHVFDAGFVKPGSAATDASGGGASGSGSGASTAPVHVAIGDYVWFDANRNGLQDAGEQPVKGALVVLLDSKGARARNAAGVVVPVQRTDAKGRYLFGGLLPGTYRVRFVYPKGYEGTITTGGDTRRDSNPPATSRNQRVALTPVFRVYASTHGNTRPFHRTGVDATYADLTIDAGLVLPAGARVSVTG